MGARRRGRVALRLDEEDLVLPFAIDLRVWQEWAVKLCEGFSLFLVCMVAQGLALAPIYIILCHLSIFLYYWCNNWRTSTSNLNLKLEATLNWPSHPHIPTQRSIVLEDPPSKAACPCFCNNGRKLCRGDKEWGCHHRTHMYDCGSPYVSKMASSRYNSTLLYINVPSQHRTYMQVMKLEMKKMHQYMQFITCIHRDIHPQVMYCTLGAVLSQWPKENSFYVWFKKIIPYICRAVSMKWFCWLTADYQ